MQLKQPAARWNGNICNNIIEDDFHQCHKFHLNIFGKYHHSPLILHLYFKYIIKMFIVLVGILTLTWVQKWSKEQPRVHRGPPGPPGPPGRRGSRGGSTQAGFPLEEAFWSRKSWNDTALSKKVPSGLISWRSFLFSTLHNVYMWQKDSPVAKNWI